MDFCYQPDLHNHTTASDGVLSPAQLIQRAFDHGVNLLAITDHDTVNGLEEGAAAAEKLGICFVRGVEIGCNGGEEVHILGYGVENAGDELHRFLKTMAEERENRTDAILERLDKLGLPLKKEEVRTGEGGVKGRPQIARAMIEKGYINDVQEGFRRYLGSGCPAYVPRKLETAEKVVDMLHRQKMLPVLAHPGLYRMDRTHLDKLVQRLIDAGLGGVEAFHPDNRAEGVLYWQRYAKQFGMLVTGGSDFHSSGDKHAEIGQMCASWS